MTAPRALLSVTDKTGIDELGTGLAEAGFELVSTGGTADVLRQANLPVTDVEEITGFPAMLDDRVKTLHPLIHAAILADQNNPDHVRTLEELGVEPFGIVVVNLYDFASGPSVKQIDVGGPTMIRGAAKNYESIAVVTDPSQYDAVLEELQANDGHLSLPTRTMLAAQAFGLTASYDGAIAAWFDEQIDQLES